MSSISLPIDSWGADGTAEGLLFVHHIHGDRAPGGYDPGFASICIDDYLQETGLEPIPIIPLVNSEQLLEKDPDAKLYIASEWPAFITGGRRHGRRRREEGPTHYKILLEARIAQDPSFIMGVIGSGRLCDLHNEVEPMHLTLGSVTVSNGVLVVSSDLVPVIGRDKLFSKRPKALDEPQI